MDAAVKVVGVGMGMREAEYLAEMDHENVIRVFCYYVSKEYLYIVMERGEQIDVDWLER